MICMAAGSAVNMARGTLPMTPRTTADPMPAPSSVTCPMVTSDELSLQRASKAPDRSMLR